MKKNRRAVKAMLVAKKVVELVECNLQGMRSNNFAEMLAYYHKSVQIVFQINSIRRTPANVFGMNGKIDKRRHRRYVTKHRPSVIVFPQMRHPLD